MLVMKKIKIKTIFFDMDETLVEIPVSPQQFLQNIFRKIGFSFTLDKISTAYTKVENKWREYFSDFTRITKEAYIQYNVDLLKTLGVKCDIQRQAEIIEEYWINLPEESDEILYFEVKEVLKRLDQMGVIVGVLSGRYLPIIEKSLEKHDIKHHFQHIITPQIANAKLGKNGPEMWELAVNKTECNREEILHMDDDYQSGIIGAKKAGIKAILIDRKKKYS